MRRYLPVMLLSIAASACVKTDPADDLGRFAVTQSRTAHCGDGTLLAAPEERLLVVRLRKVSDHVLHWYQGEELFVLNYDAASGSFGALGQVTVDMRAGDTTLPTCIMERDEQLQGTLQLDELGEPSAMEGELTYDFAASANSSCDDLMAAEVPIANELPCSIAYDFVGDAL